ncbi:MAG: hypothetical protein KTR28_00365, partial [Micavibrio sp.]|nr:hypothetical protein [Micavibrio sp.]
MSETGFTKLTAFLRGDGAGGKASGGNESRILTLPAALRAEASTLRAGLRLRGEVVSQNPDSSVSVRTERGVVDIIPPKNRSLPTKGTEVEINIAPQRGGREETPRAELRIIRQAESSRGNTTPVEVNVESGRRPEQTQLSRSQQETSNALSRAKAQLERMTGAQTKPTPAKDVAPAPDVSSEKVPKQANTAQAQNSSASTQKVSEALKAFYTQGLPDVGDLVRLTPTKTGPSPAAALA